MFSNHPFNGCNISRNLSGGLVAILALVAFSANGLTAQETRSDGQQREIMQGLEAGANALRAIGRNDEAAHLIEIAKQHGNPSGNRDRPQQQERAPNDRNQTDRGMNERQMAEQQLEVFRIAHHAFREAERGDAMELVERTIHGREMQLSGRRDEEAQQAIREIPGREDQIDLLNRASEILQEFGHEARAGQLRELAASMNRQGQERRETRDRPAPDRPAPDRQNDERDVNRERQMEQIHQHLIRLTEQVEQMQKQLKEIRDRK